MSSFTIGTIKSKFFAANKASTIMSCGSLINAPIIFPLKFDPITLHTLSTLITIGSNCCIFSVNSSTTLFAIVMSLIAIISQSHFVVILFHFNSFSSYNFVIVALTKNGVPAVFSIITAANSFIPSFVPNKSPSSCCICSSFNDLRVIVDCLTLAFFASFISSCMSSDASLYDKMIANPGTGFLQHTNLMSSSDAESANCASSSAITNGFSGDVNDFKNSVNTILNRSNAFFPCNSSIFVV
mmetsp:Transcript_12471/g.18633  ORF Transcript_12471/g.18633 Transcript_12471/m.18633 type:complete len:241 (-) Transcript_12471:136-858(-)